jgi:hypothetical protein
VVDNLNLADGVRSYASLSYAAFMESASDCSRNFSRPADIHCMGSSGLGPTQDLNHPGNVLFHVDEATNAGFVGQNVTYKLKIDGQKLSMATTIKSATGGEVEFLSTYDYDELSNRAGCKCLIGTASSSEPPLVDASSSDGGELSALLS